jgi:Predicted sulfurtransferase
MILHNRYNKEELLKRLESETFKRKTLSFYRYVTIDKPWDLRNKLYQDLVELECNGRIYIAREGINAQINIPEHNKTKLLALLDRYDELQNMPIKWALEERKHSFYKMIIKVRKKIVADGLNEDDFDVTNVGQHLSPLEFHKLTEDENNIVVDMRNHYESAIGRFKNAWCPDVDTFREEIELVVNELSEMKERKILLYCTGGVRCEKASAYMRHKGFQDVNQLHGGIIAYAEEIRNLGLESNFIGKNFVFDERMAESVTNEILGQCHQCGAPCDNYTNCANDDCHLLFIQCNVCKERYAACCSDDCKSVLALSEPDRFIYRNTLREKYAGSQIFRSRLRPKLSESGHNLQKQ